MIKFVYLIKAFIYWIKEFSIKSELMLYLLYFKGSESILSLQTNIGWMDSCRSKCRHLQSFLFFSKAFSHWIQCIYGKKKKIQWVQRLSSYNVGIMELILSSANTLLIDWWRCQRRWRIYLLLWLKRSNPSW